MEERDLHIKAQGEISVDWKNKYKDQIQIKQIGFDWQRSVNYQV